MILIGGGQFGRLALERLGNRIRMVVEPHPGERIVTLARMAGAEVCVEHGAKFLHRILKEKHPPVWVIPATPQHLLADWLLTALGNQGLVRLKVPREALPPVPSLIPGADDQVLLSLADFRCPNDCPEPAQTCTVTGRPQGLPLYKRLSAINLPNWSTGVLRSHQLAPGVGGYQSTALIGLKQRILKQKGGWLVATACRCHGIVGAVNFG